MKKPNDADRLNHILDAIAKIERYLQGFDVQKFQQNEEKIDAVVRNIEIIGEATTCLDRGLKAKYPQVEWRFATAIRNRLIHGYFDIDAEIVWNTTQNDLPKLKTEIEKILEELEK
ncbi:DUF86 domain-containing protein [soil metagenome]